MTLPFRRRHHDQDATHQRAMSIVVEGFLEPTPDDAAAWLADHLAGCAECRLESAALRSDRDLLRTLRDAPPVPPRDLWARTAAAIEAHPAARPDRRRQILPGRLAGLPLGALSGALVVLVVVGASLLPGLIPSGPDVAEPTGRTSGAPIATPISVVAGSIGWVSEADDGSFQVHFATIDRVCVGRGDGCAPLEATSAATIRLTDSPRSVLVSPNRKELVVVTSGATSEGTVLVMRIPEAPVASEPPASPSVSVGPSPSMPSSSPAPSDPVSPDPASPDPMSPGPSEPTRTGDPTVSPEPTPEPTPEGQVTIATGVVVVGDTAYSPDGTWLAFSARPVDGSAGPDLYLWQAGDATARAVTTDHGTYFAGWVGDRLLVSRAVVAEPVAVATPGPTDEPAPTATPVGSADATASPDPAATPAPVTATAIAALIDPVTLEETPLVPGDLWLPVVDPTASRVAYWSGTIVADGTGTGWRLGEGRLLLDGWRGQPVDGPAASGDLGSPAPSSDVEPTLDPTLAPTPGPLEPGPAGGPVVLLEGPIGDLEVRFDPTGTRLAIWTADPADPSTGTLRLLVIDPATGLVDPAVAPLAGVPALRGFSLDAGRLAWVTPAGQDGQGSHLEILGWSKDVFGSLSADPARRVLVLR